MAKIEFPKKELEKYIDVNESNIDKMNMFGTTVESVSEEKIELEISANRPDLFSLHGFVRSFKTFIGKEKPKKYTIRNSNYLVKVDKSVKQIRPFTECAVITGLSLNDEKLKEIIYVQEKLHQLVGRQRRKMAIGIYPLEKIKFPVSYEAKKPTDISFVPLGASETMNAPTILKKHPSGRDYADLLKGLDKYPIFIDSKKNILSMPPIINSEHIGRVSKETKDLFIECSGNNRELLKKTISILAAMFDDMGGKINSVTVKDDKTETSPNMAPKKVKLSPEEAEKILGISLNEKSIEKLLQKMGYEYKNKTAFAPAWRADIIGERDIIEDIAISYGYNNIKPEIPKVSTVGEESAESSLKRKLSEILIGLGFIETSSHHLIKMEDVEKSKIKRPIQIEESKTDYKFLRPNLKLTTLRTYSENTNVEYPQNLFEIGKVFTLNELTETGVEEKTRIVVSLSPGNFTESKRVLDYLSKCLSLEISVKDSFVEDLIEGRTAAVILKGKEIGYLGEVHPASLKKWGIKMPCSIMEISFDAILKEIYPK